MNPISGSTLPCPGPRDLFLKPGDFAFGDEHTRLRTILGSCVAVTFWQPDLKWGAMCHYLLPGRLREPGAPMDGRYGDEVLEIISNKLQTKELSPERFHVKMFGGSNMSPGRGNLVAQSIGEKNLEIGAVYLRDKGFQILNADVGHCQHRALLFDIQSGEVWVRRGPSGCEMKCVFRPEEGCPHLQGMLDRIGSTPAPAH